MIPATKFLEKYCRFIDRTNRLVGKLASWLIFLLVIIVFLDVTMRYAFNTSYVFIQEVEWHLFALILMLGAGATLLYDNHVRVDIFYQKLSPKGKAWINTLGCIFFLFPGCYLIIYTSIPFVVNSYTFLEGSPNPGGIPYRFLLKATIPLGLGLVFLQGICLLIRSIYTILDKKMED